MIAHLAPNRFKLALIDLPNYDRSAPLAPDGVPIIGKAPDVGSAA